MRAFLPVVAAAIILSGCGNSRGISPAGPDTYTLTERFAAIRGGGDEAERDALLKAHDFWHDDGAEVRAQQYGSSNRHL